VRSRDESVYLMASTSGTVYVCTSSLQPGHQQAVVKQWAVVEVISLPQTAPPDWCRSRPWWRGRLDVVSRLVIARGQPVTTSNGDVGRRSQLPDLQRSTRVKFKKLLTNSLINS